MPCHRRHLHQPRIGAESSSVGCFVSSLDELQMPPISDSELAARSRKLKNNSRESRVWREKCPLITGTEPPNGKYSCPSQEALSEPGIKTRIPQETNAPLSLSLISQLPRRRQRQLRSSLLESESSGTGAVGNYGPFDVGPEGTSHW